MRVNASVSKKRPKLLTHVALEACRRLSKAGAPIYEYASSLEADGFSAFLPEMRFLESFAESQEELLLHRQCNIEKAKMTLGRPWPMCAGRDESGYESAFIAELISQRDKLNGVPGSMLRKAYPGVEYLWRSHYDPCWRRLTSFELSFRDEYNERVHRVAAERRAEIEKESSVKGTNLAKSASFGVHDQREVYRTVMIDRAPKIGFVYDERRSRPGFPIFSKELTKDWSLCLVLEDDRLLTWGAFEWSVEPYLELRSRAVVGRIGRAGEDEWLHIRHNALIPGFFRAYSFFREPEELELMVSAHLCLCGTLLPAIEVAFDELL